MAMWLDRYVRFGKSTDDSKIIAKIQGHQAEVAESWQNYIRHRNGHASGGTICRMNSDTHHFTAYCNECKEERSVTCSPAERDPASRSE